MNIYDKQQTTSVSVVIPILNAEDYLPSLLPAILEQEPAPPVEIILIDSMSTDNTREIASRFEKVEVIPIQNFSHGRARNLGAQHARGDIIVLMTQDAIPANKRWLDNLLKPFDDTTIAATFSRQQPYEHANPVERFFLHSHFPPDKSIRREKGDHTSLSFEDVFFSNVSAAIRRDLLLEYPFDEELIMSEDQQFARDILNAGYATVYQADSVVIHSHNYTLCHAFRRYFDSVYSITKLFNQHDLGASASMGMRYLQKEALHIARNHPFYFPYYILYTCAKTGGTVTGHYADKMPKWLARACSLHRYYWE